MHAKKNTYLDRSNYLRSKNFNSTKWFDIKKKQGADQSKRPFNSTSRYAYQGMPGHRQGLYSRKPVVQKIDDVGNVNAAGEIKAKIRN